MTPEKQRVAIAKFCGWKYCDAFLGQDKMSGGRSKGWKPGQIHEGFVSILPDYLHDLNAMHEAEKFLTPTQEEHYVERLSGALMSAAYENDDDERWLKSNLSSTDSTYRATAPQRAEALLHTINKWKD
jgi:hypothetical protein